MCGRTESVMVRVLRILKLSHWCLLLRERLFHQGYLWFSDIHLIARLKQCLGCVLTGNAIGKVELLTCCASATESFMKTSELDAFLMIKHFAMQGYDGTPHSSPFHYSTRI
ncbi:hypothetical protein Tco_0503957 [Tanacetum coccineum]